MIASGMPMPGLTADELEAFRNASEELHRARLGVAGEAGRTADPLPALATPQLPFTPSPRRSRSSSIVLPSQQSKARSSSSHNKRCSTSNARARSLSFSEGLQPPSTESSNSPVTPAPSRIESSSAPSARAGTKRHKSGSPTPAKRGKPSLTQKASSSRSTSTSVEEASSCASAPLRRSSRTGALNVNAIRSIHDEEMNASDADVLGEAILEPACGVNRDSSPSTASRDQLSTSLSCSGATSSSSPSKQLTDCRPSPLSLESPAETKAGDDPVMKLQAPRQLHPRGLTTAPADKVESASTLASLGGVDDATTNSTLPGVSMRRLPPGKHPAWSPNDSSEGEPTGNEGEVGDSSGDEVSRPCNANKVVEASDESDSEQTGRNTGQRRTFDDGSSLKRKVRAGSRGDNQAETKSVKAASLKRVSIIEERNAIFSWSYYGRFIQGLAAYGAVLYQIKDDDFAPGGDLTVARKVFTALRQTVRHDELLHPVRFCGRVLKENELNYHPAEKEVLALLQGLKICYTLLAGKTLHIYTRFSTLEWVFQSKSLFGRSVQFAVFLSQWHLKVKRMRERDIEFAKLFQSSITPFVALDEAVAPLAPPLKGSATVRMSPHLLYASVARDYNGCVLSFDGSAKTEKHGGHGSCSWILWRRPAWDIVIAASAHLSSTTVNIAENTGTNNGVKAALDHGVTNLIIVGDSRLAIEQSMGVIACQKETLQVQLMRHKELTTKLNSVRYLHAVRAYNASADSLATEALESQVTKIVLSGTRKTELTTLKRIPEVLYSADEQALADADLNSQTAARCRRAEPINKGLVDEQPQVMALTRSQARRVKFGEPVTPTTELQILLPTYVNTFD
ncbi:unnamed protein product [Phytophthora lilii]|uniref:Unnamed protein product n=1 Tax=Phytophthora lilii TaxID=2077276 RepID=A0A9W6WUS9_9STRA|nr:unnamed protein product [Phytophthora lilii]